MLVLDAAFEPDLCFMTRIRKLPKAERIAHDVTIGEPMPERVNVTEFERAEGEALSNQKGRKRLLEGRLRSEIWHGCILE